MYCVNAAEQAIYNSKNNLISIVCSTEPNFTIEL